MKPTKAKAQEPYGMTPKEIKEAKATLETVDDDTSTEEEALTSIDFGGWHG